MAKRAIQKATIKDVALRAGVSTATVSYVINRNRFVSDKLARQVHKAIRELSFTPSKVAQSLRRGRTMTVGLIMDDITNRFGAMFTQGLENAAAEHKYSLIISDLHENPANEDRSIDLLLDQNVDGIIYCGYGVAERRLVELFAGGLPVVIADKPLATGQLPSVLIDNQASLFLALDHLRALGHKDVVFINGLKINRNARLRAEAFQQFMARHCLPCSEQQVIYGDYTLQHGFQTARQIVRQRRRFTALVCGDDMVAFGAVAALRAAGVRIPEDVAVVGFDDDPITSVFDPSLTTIHYPMHEMGRRSFEVFQQVAGQKHKRAPHVLLKTTLMIRRSTDVTYRDDHELD